jgi:hypothetical protein
MRYRYEIDTNKAIRVWDTQNPNENDAPFFFQPDWPNGSAWANKAEAEDWANVFIESLVNPDSDFVAGDSPENHPAPRPVEEEEEPEN